MKLSRLTDTLGPGGTRAVALLVLCAGARAVGLILVAEGIAGAIALLAGGQADVAGAAATAAAGALLRGLATWAQGVAASRGAIAAKSQLRRRLAEHTVAAGGADPSSAGQTSTGRGAAKQTAA